MRHRLSIIIPTYNRPSILPRAVASALVACPESAEIIVVDDRSNTAQTALISMSGDPRLRIVANDGDKGAAGARNFGVSIARGDIILFLDDDDELIPDYPERVLAAAAHSKADFGFSAALLVDHRLNTERSSTKEKSKALQQGVLTANVPLQDKMPGLSRGVWIRKATFQDVGGICPAQIVDEDGDLFCRLFGFGHTCWFEAAPGVRIHKAYETGGQLVTTLSTGTDSLVEAECRLRTYQRNHPYFPQRSADRWFLIRRILRHAAYKGVDNVAISLLADIKPIDWRLRGWIFWKLKKTAAIRQYKQENRSRMQ
ncbi:glycosyl transferase family 2 [Loktanella sp. PT4BL]|jgi:glycosyltransferase involved in cell wall biosynthesis|uniref:glycosyltransferase family 2 protein n=1 Tax=Loktanella sp. PT4BL TaxID=2135611 RepID=UPI000D76F503|nr:glycosyltransferase [Loktanella sp. PT4BL]PXW69288.1 glycosyl transferase family 2 [Loktanella sp. PT4BL]